MATRRSTRNKEKGLDNESAPCLPTETSLPMKDSAQKNRKAPSAETTHTPLHEEHHVAPAPAVGPKSKKRGKDPVNAMVPAGRCDDSGGASLPTPAPTKKRGRKTATERSQEEDDPPLKRPRSGVDTNGDAPAKPVRGQKPKPVPVAKRDPLPNREARNAHPAPPPPAARRSSKEVNAQREAHRQAMEDKIREGERAKQLLAAMNVSEERDDEKIDVEYPNRLSAAIRKRGREVLDEDSEGEAFNFEDVEAASYSDDEPESEVEIVKKKIVKTSKKAAKDKLRDEVDDLAANLRGSGRKDGDGKMKENKRLKMAASSLTPLDTAPKKYPNAGLRKAVNAKGFKLKAPEQHDPLQNGGLGDEDANATRPAYSRSSGQAPRPALPETLKRDHSRQNTMIELESSDDDSKAPAKKRGKKAAPQKVRTVHSGKAPRGEVVPTQTGKSVDLSAQYLEDARWVKIFIPTLTHSLYISREPFLDFTAESSNFVETVQEVFDASFPNVDLELKRNDKVVITAYERVKTRKSKLAGEILEHIENFFKTPDFADQPAKIRLYVRWALRYDGPAFYEVPTPEYCTVPREHPDYKRPEGFLRSQFVTPFATKFLKYAKSSALRPILNESKPPKGLYALIMLSVERAFRAHLKTPYVSPPAFSHKNSWEALKVYLHHIDRLSENRWRGILEFRMEADEEIDEDGCADESMISAYRQEIFIPSSPQKG